LVGGEKAAPKRGVRGKGEFWTRGGRKKTHTLGGKCHDLTQSGAKRIWSQESPEDHEHKKNLRGAQKKGKSLRRGVKKEMEGREEKTK